VTLTAQDAVCHHEHGHRAGEGREYEGQGPDAAPGHADQPAAVLVGQGADHGPGHQVDPREQGARPRDLAAALLEVGGELPEEDAEGVGDPVDDHVAHEGGEDHYPAVASVRGRRDVVVLAEGAGLLLRRGLVPIAAPAGPAARQPGLLLHGVLALRLKAKAKGGGLVAGPVS
jgi:hypothetical protein